MKGDITIRILETLTAVATDSADLFEAFITSGYGASSGKIQREFSKIQNERSRKNRIQEAHAKYSRMLYKLKRDGLIGEKTVAGTRIFAITAKGSHKLRNLKASQQHMLPQYHYKRLPSERSTIVAFDIPERDRKKRNWLRAALSYNGFTLIQRSVWMGNIKLPEEFIDDLRHLKMLEYVHIFEITKAGTLHEV